jgi:hypothetical protein
VNNVASSRLKPIKLGHGFGCLWSDDTSVLARWQLVIAWLIQVASVAKCQFCAILLCLYMLRYSDGVRRPEDARKE